eukprot:6469118-Amphidinium_carterae.2
MLNEFLVSEQSNATVPTAVTLSVAVETTVAFITGFSATSSFVSGGGKKRARSLSSDATLVTIDAARAADHPHDVVYWPTWRVEALAAHGTGTLVHVSVSDARPVDVSFPADLGLEQVEALLARHVACRTDWLTFTWAGSDVFIEFSAAYPLLTSDAALRLNKLFHEMPSGSSQRRAATQGKEVIIGHRRIAPQELPELAFTPLDIMMIHDVWSMPPVSWCPKPHSTLLPWCYTVLLQRTATR